MKINKQKGFTLIELLVVIAIIALLSSVVLGSLKSAREKAILNKTIAEMKSLQQSLELYRNDKGVYPGVLNYLYEDDENDSIYGEGNINTFFQTYLVNNKYISKVPHAPNYPNNCSDYSSCYNSGYVLGYSLYTTDEPNPPYHTCGRQPIKNYFIFLQASTKKLNLPLLETYQPAINGYTSYYFNDYPQPYPIYIYCLSM